MNQSPIDQLQMASGGLSGIFFYEAGGFSLFGCSYRLQPLPPPEMPTRERFEQRLPLMPLAERKAHIDHLIADAERWYPLAVDAYTRAPYRVTVRVPGDAGAHVLEYLNADRFLRQIGVLRACTNCGTWSLHLDGNDAIGRCCTYRSRDRSMS